MIKKYKKSELNIDNAKKDIHLNILTYSNENYVNVKIIDQKLEAIELEYEITENMKGLKNIKKNFYQERLRLFLNIINLVKSENKFLTSDLSPENILYTEELKVMFIEREIKMFEETEEEIVYKLKRILGFLFLEGDFEEIKKGDEKLLSKHPVSKKILGAKTIEELRTIVESTIDTYQTKYYKNEMILPKKKFRSLVNFKRINIFIYLILILGLLFYGAYQLPQLRREIAIVNDYQKQEYDKVIETLKKTDISRIENTIKYDAVVAVIKLENLSDNQKDNILSNLSYNTDSQILDYWLLIGIGSYEEAYNLSLDLKDFDLQEYALLKQLDMLDLSDMSSKDKQAKRDELQGQIDAIEKQKLEQTEAQ